MSKSRLCCRCKKPLPKELVSQNRFMCDYCWTYVNQTENGCYNDNRFVLNFTNNTNNEPNYLFELIHLSAGLI